MNLKSKKQAIRVDVFSKEDCHLCDVAKEVIRKVRKKIPFHLQEIDITDDRNLFESFKEQIPVVFVNGRKCFKYRVDEDKFTKLLEKLS